MDITVSICTWNRADLLAQALERFTKLSVPRDLRWELLIIDNASVDNTKGVVESFSPSLPVRYTYEPDLGLSYARNHAIKKALGRFIVWTDDDVLVDPKWLSSYARGIKKYPQADVFGGPIEPWFELQPPAWMEQTWPLISKYHAVRQVPRGSEFIDSKHLPNGANFATRTDVQSQYLYDPSEGRKGTELFSGEEATIIRSILNTGGTGVWLTEARVHHYLPAERMTLRYLRRTVRDTGKQWALRQVAKGDAIQQAYLFGSPRWLWRRALELHALYLVQRLTVDPERWMKTMLQASLMWGKIRGFRVQRK